MQDGNDLDAVDRSLHLNEQEQRRLADLCNIFGIPISRTEPCPPAALVTLVHLFSLPCIEDEEDFDEYAAAIMDYCEDYFGYSGRWHTLTPRKQSQRRAHDMGDGAFQYSVQRTIQSMDWFPWMYSELRKSPEELARTYEILGWLALALKLLGGAAAADAVSSFGSGVATALEKNSVRAGIERAAQTAMGQGSLARGILARIGASPFSPIGIAIAVGGAASYMVIIDMMEDIREIVEYRFQSGEVSDAVYDRVFGDFNFDAAEIEKYGPWEGI